MPKELELVTGIEQRVWPPILAGGVLVALTFWSYHRLARILKWITLVFAYVVAAFLARPEWPAALLA